MTVETAPKDKQIIIEVPEDRVAEFYALYGHFLAGFPGRRHRGHGPRGHRCGSHRGEPVHAEQTQAAPGPEAATA